MSLYTTTGAQSTSSQLIQLPENSGSMPLEDMTQEELMCAVANSPQRMTQLHLVYMHLWAPMHLFFFLYAALAPSVNLLRMHLITLLSIKCLYDQEERQRDREMHLFDQTNNQNMYSKIYQSKIKVIHLQRNELAKTK